MTRLAWTLPGASPAVGPQRSPDRIRIRSRLPASTAREDPKSIELSPSCAPAILRPIGRACQAMPDPPLRTGGSRTGGGGGSTGGTGTGLGGSMIGGGRSGSGGGSGGVPGGGCGVGPCAECGERISVSKIGAPPVVFPIAMAGRLRPLWAADFARLLRLSLFGESGRTRLGSVAGFFLHVPDMGGNVVASTGVSCVRFL